MEHSTRRKPTAIGEGEVLAVNSERHRGSVCALAGRAALFRFFLQNLEATNLGVTGGAAAQGDDDSAIGIRRDGGEVLHHSFILAAFSGNVEISEHALTVDVHVELALAGVELRLGKMEANGVARALLDRDGVGAFAPALALVNLGWSRVGHIGV